MKNIFCVLLLTIPVPFGQDAEAQQVLGDWPGFRKKSFLQEGIEAYIVIPDKALPGNPWIWRARFPDRNPGIDSTLVSLGFHIAFINTQDMYGSPDAMDIWDRFYDHLVSAEGLNEEVILLGADRGGLSIYAWAKRHPERISCIYAESPVCDIKSWPLGFGKSSGSTEDSLKLMEAYGFASVNEAIAYSGNPVDNLEVLAAENIPILHVIGLNDRQVPPDEHTLVLASRYARLGGKLTVLPNSGGKGTPQGQQIDLDDPGFVVAFIRKNSLPVLLLDSRDYHAIRGGISNCRIKFEQGKKGRVAFLGGSITWNPGWRDSIGDFLRKRFPLTEFEFINAGIPSMGSTSGAFRLYGDLLSKGQTDLLFVEAAVNDRSIGRTSDEQIKGMEGIVRHARNENPEMDIIIINFADPWKIEDYQGGHIPEEIENHEKVAGHYDIPSVNLAKEVTDRISAGEFTWEEDFKDLHPSPFGQQIYACSIIALLECCWSAGTGPAVQPVQHDMPDMLDPWCYDQGELIPIGLAEQLNGWQIDTSWVPADGVRTRPGFVNVPMITAEQPGAALSLEFTGRAVGAVIVAGPDAGTLEYSIDHESFRKIDLFTQWSAGLYLPGYCIFDGKLKPGPHTLELRISTERNPESLGFACRIKNFLVNR